MLHARRVTTPATMLRRAHRATPALLELHATRALSTTAGAAASADAESKTSKIKAPRVYFTTRDRIDGREVIEEFGLVSASAVRSKSVLSDMYVALSGLFGGEAPSYTSLMNETMAEAVHRMQFAAQGATAVVNVRFDTNTTMNRLVFGLHCSVIAYGTAVRCRPAVLHHHQPAGDAPVVPSSSSPSSSSGGAASSDPFTSFKKMF